MARQVDQNVDALIGDAPGGLVVGQSEQGMPCHVEVLQAPAQVVGLGQCRVKGDVQNPPIEIGKHVLHEIADRVSAQVAGNKPEAKASSGFGRHAVAWPAAAQRFLEVLAELQVLGIQTRRRVVGIILRGEKEVAVRLRIVGIEPQGVAKAGVCGIPIASVKRQRAQISVGCRGIRLERDGLFKTGQCLVEAPQISLDDAEAIVGVGEIGLEHHGAFEAGLSVV